MRCGAARRGRRQCRWLADGTQVKGQGACWLWGCRRSRCSWS
jgi:hypothetical protein